MSANDRSDRYVTTVVSRRLRPGREREFDEFIRGITETVSRFPDT